MKALSTTSLLFIRCLLKAQTMLPEQDCINAIPACNGSFLQVDTYKGEGANTNEIPFSSCLANQENNSVWYTFEVLAAGELKFTIDPLAADDYDFALYDITGRTCSDVLTGNAPEVRCSYAVANGVTGIADGGTGISEGADGNALLAPLPVTVGKRYALMVDNFAGLSVSGFALDFTASTALIGGVKAAPFSNDTVFYCKSPSEIEISVSSYFDCSTLAADGSDFYIPNNLGLSILGAQGVACDSINNSSRSVRLTLSNSLPNGTFPLYLKVGSDGNTLTSVCNDTFPNDTLYLIYYKCIAMYTVSELDNNSIQVYPNPTVDELFVSTTNAIATEVQIINLLGETVLVQSLGGAGQEAMMVHVHHLPSGTYIVKVQQGSSTFAKRIVLMR
ncbi:MAG: T9SS type A sorting domain-containing protein [Chitinophagales bacterium]|nr:T9SS type A sorting domain-containing protein [Chitinophagales bacterium]